MACVLPPTGVHAWSVYFLDWNHDRWRLTRYKAMAVRTLFFFLFFASIIQSQ